MYLKLMSRLEAVAARVVVELLTTLIYLVRPQKLVLNTGLASYFAKKRCENLANLSIIYNSKLVAIKIFDNNEFKI